MNLLQLIESVWQGTSIEEVAAHQIPHPDAEEAGFYMHNEANLNSQLVFFDLEQVPPYLFITVADKKHESFFSLSELADFIPEYTNSLGKTATPQTVAEALIHYHKYGA
ncbi:hypothetical protein QMK33_02885 [Hymenobacter sp. H14-R3]|uniref:hypothetical protein n=1 Tax=Hymenobacter sp. H14-R3 TaxID=3046308 RepID=UPI0024BB9C87|nr:hypothetical protein [Hymenobacter sp. H14-R3]MDJ0364084.1 hypothetical protein [Hymenobacter sp. H14-R3]